MGIKPADWGKTTEFLPVQLQVTFPQSSKESTRGTVHQGKSCAGGCARVSHTPGCHCKEKQELSQRGSFPRVHSIAGLAPQTHTKQTVCSARTQRCLPCLGSHSRWSLQWPFASFSFVLFLFFLPTLATQLKVFACCSPLPFPHYCCSIPS